MSQETLADQVVKTNEEKYKLTEKLEAANKVSVVLYAPKLSLLKEIVYKA